jgi:tRNA 2-selenouridine synthase
VKNPAVLSIEEVIAQLQQFDTIIDVRSPSEFAEDHIPGAINCPVLSDEERAQVGTIYKQVDSFEARKIGAALSARNIAHHLETQFLAKPKQWNPLVYCWRGGNRSGSMAHILAKVGWRVVQLDGGYKSYRHFVLDDLDLLPNGLQFRSVCGATGSGKSRLLRALAEVGAQVLDLEQIACHKGSVLGEMETQEQPPQKMFESRVWAALRGFSPERPVYVESESKKIGNLRVPEILMGAMRAAPCIVVDLSRQDRIRLLMEEYEFFLREPERLKKNLRRLLALHGEAVIGEWEAMVDTGQWEELVAVLLDKHYDPAYSRSIRRNFSRFDDAQRLHIDGVSFDRFCAAAKELQALDSTMAETQDDRS